MDTWVTTESTSQLSTAIIAIIGAGSAIISAYLTNLANKKMMADQFKREYSSAEHVKKMQSLEEIYNAICHWYNHTMERHIYFTSLLNSGSTWEEFLKNCKEQKSNLSIETGVIEFKILSNFPDLAKSWEEVIDSFRDIATLETTYILAKNAGKDNRNELIGRARLVINKFQNVIKTFKNNVLKSSGTPNPALNSDAAATR